VLSLYAERSVLARAQEALADGRRLHLPYYVPGRDEATKRDVDPMRLLVVEGRTYLGGGAAGRRRSGCSGWTGCCESTCSTWQPRCPARPSRWTWTRGRFRPAPTDMRVVLELMLAAGGWPTT